MKKTQTLVLLFVLVVLMAFYAIKKIREHSAPVINVSRLQLRELQGTKVETSSFPGKPLVINFFGTWCAPCREELKSFESIVKRFGNDINFIFISDEPLSTLNKFRNTNFDGLHYAQSLEPFGTLGIRSVPATYFFDANGKLVTKKYDLLNAGQIERYLSRIAASRQRQ